MEQLVLPSGVSRTNTIQKSIAAGIILLAAYLVLPPFTAMLSALGSLVLLVIAVGLVVYTFQNPWILKAIYLAFDAFAWQLTRAFISLNPIVAMERYYEWLLGVGQEITESRKALETQLLSTSQSIDARDAAYQKNMQMADKLEKEGKAKQAEAYLLNAQEDEAFVKNMLPLKNETENQRDLLKDAEDAFETKAKQLDYSIKAQKEQYKLIKTTHTGMNNAKTALGNAGQMQKIFNEAQSQLNQRMNQMTVDVANIKEMLTPTIENNKLEKSIAIEEGRKKLAEFRAKQLKAQ